jgi:hypothetical protein
MSSKAFVLFFRQFNETTVVGSHLLYMVKFFLNQG